MNFSDCLYRVRKIDLHLKDIIVGHYVANSCSFQGFNTRSGKGKPSEFQWSTRKQNPSYSGHRNYPPPPACQGHSAVDFETGRWFVVTVRLYFGLGSVRSMDFKFRSVVSVVCSNCSRPRKKPKSPSTFPWREILGDPGNLNLLTLFFTLFFNHFGVPFGSAFCLNIWKQGFQNSMKRVHENGSKNVLFRSALNLQN